MPRQKSTIVNDFWFIPRGLRHEAPAGERGHLLSMAHSRVCLGILLVVGVLVLGYRHGDYLHRRLNGHMATLEIEAQISGGTRFQVYVNDQWSEPQATKIVPRQWTTYKFPVPSRATTLRIDPSELGGAVVLLKGIRLRSADGSVQNLGVSNLLSWSRVGMDVSAPDPGTVIRIAILESGAYTMGPAALDVTKQTLPFPSWYRLNPAGFLWALLIFALFLLSSVQRWPSWRPLATAGAVFISAWATYLIARRLQLSLKALPAVSDAVGYAAFFGYPKQGEIEAVNLALFAGLIISATAAVVIFRGTSWQRFSRSESPWRRRDWLFLGGCLVLFACGSLPASFASYQSALEIKHPADFDSQNVMYWEYAVDQGKLPFRDFWYPYSGMYHEATPLYPYLAFSWAEEVLVFGVLALSLYVCVRRSWGASLALWATLLLMKSADLFWHGGLWRYLLSASVVLFAAAALEERSRWMAAGFGLWAAYSISEELSQPIYAVPAVVFLFIVTLWRHRKRLSDYLPIVLTSVAAFLASFGSYLLLLIYRGQLGGWLAFIREAPSSTLYSAWPLDFQAWLATPQTVQQLYLLVVVILLAAGAPQL